MNRNDMKEYFKNLKRGQHSGLSDFSQQKSLLKETITPNLSQVNDALANWQDDGNDPNDISGLSTYHAWHEDEIRDILDNTDSMTVDMSRQHELMPIGGGIGRGLELAKTNLKNALDDLYQEVIDSEDEDTIEAAQAEAALEIGSIIRMFFNSKGML